MRCEVRNDITWEQCTEEGEHEVHLVTDSDGENALAWKAETSLDRAVSADRESYYRQQYNDRHRPGA